MPIKSIIPPNDRARLEFTIHKELKKKLIACSKNHFHLSETLNYFLAHKFAPELLQVFDEYKKKPLKFPNRIVKNRFSRRKA